MLINYTGSMHGVSGVWHMVESIFSICYQCRHVSVNVS